MIQTNFLNCTKEQFGTGILSCEVPDGVPTDLLLVPKGWELDLTTGTFDNAYIEGQIKAGNFIPALNSIDYEDASEEAEFFTTSTKNKLKTVPGKAGFKFTFSNGYNFHKALYALNSYNNYDILIGYDNGVIFGVKTPDGKLKAHTGGLVETGNFLHRKGGDPQKTVLEVNLSSAYEYNQSGVMLDPTANGFNLQQLSGIVDVVITKVSNSTADVVIKAVMRNNEAIGLQGLQATDLKATGTSATIVSLAYDTGLNDGTYTITFSADVSADYAGLSIKLFDSSDSTDVVKIGNKLYKGATA
jgi:hypothetical protein